MMRVQQKFWEDKQTYHILDDKGVVQDNLKIEQVLEYCIQNHMLTSLGFLIGEDYDTKTLYEDLLRRKNII